MQEEVHKALSVLKNGGVILYPTDTVWGLGCDACNEDAVEKIFRIKKREEGKSMIVLVPDEQMLNKYVSEVPAAAWDLIEVADKPLTIVYEKVRGMAQNVTAEDGSCGIRITHDPFCRDLVRRLGRPLVSTSANLSGMKPAASFAEVDPLIREAVDHVVEWRMHDKTETRPSAVIMVKNNGEIKVIRK